MKSFIVLALVLIIFIFVFHKIHSRLSHQNENVSDVQLPEGTAKAVPIETSKVGSHANNVSKKVQEKERSLEVLEPQRDLQPVSSPELTLGVHKKISENLDMVTYTAEEYKKLHPRWEPKNIPGGVALKMVKLEPKNGEKIIPIEQTQSDCQILQTVPVSVILRVDTEGHVTDATPLSQNYQGSIPDAVFQCSFKPLLVNGVAHPFVTMTHSQN